MWRTREEAAVSDDDDGVADGAADDDDDDDDEDERWGGPLLDGRPVGKKAAVLLLVLRAALSRVRLEIKRTILPDISLPSSKQSVSCLLTCDEYWSCDMRRVTCDK